MQLKFVQNVTLIEDSCHRQGTCILNKKEFQNLILLCASLALYMCVSRNSVLAFVLHYNVIMLMQ